jgi:hypothetical protein
MTPKAAAPRTATATQAATDSSRPLPLPPPAGVIVSTVLKK